MSVDMTADDRRTLASAPPRLSPRDIDEAIHRAGVRMVQAAIADATEAAVDATSVGESTLPQQSRIEYLSRLAWELTPATPLPLLQVQEAIGRTL